MFKKMTSLAALAVCLAAHPAFAQDEQDEQSSVEVSTAAFKRDTYITVVATGTPVDLPTAGQPLTIISAEEIADIQGADIGRVLERAPGVTITRNGGIGGFAGVRVRGAEAEQLLVLIDGVRVNDPASPAGGFDFGNLLPAGIGKIELLRGSNSVIWGSQALGGVLAIASRADYGNGVDLAAEYGSHETFYGNGTARISTGGLSASVSAGHYRSDGISSFDGGSEADGFRQTFVSGRADLSLTDGLVAELRGRFADGRLDLDGFAPPTFAFGDTDDFQDTREISGYAGLHLFTDNLDLRGGFSLSDTSRDSFDDFGLSFGSDGRSERLELRGAWNLADAFTLNFGVESEDSFYETGPFGSSGKTGIDSAHAMLRFDNDAVMIAAGARIDDHQQFGSEVTLGANGSVRLAQDVRLRASYGEGFKAPTLFQLLSDFGNPLLQPETSRSYDVSLELHDRNALGRVHAALTLFGRDTRNQIDFISCFGVTSAICTGRPFGTYDNIGQTRARGFEAELGANPGEARNLHLRLAYSFVDTENRTPGSPNRGNQLARRPEHALTASADWETPIGLTVGGDVRLVSDSFDNASNTVRNDGYVVTTLRASFAINDALELYGRVENLFDSQYQTVFQYNTPGRTGAVGIRAKF